MSQDPTRTELLLEDNLGWIRSLAREMASDVDRAEDLVQETCVVALQSSPDDVGSFRAWLAAVMRNLLRQSGRSDQRRERREELAARGEGLASTAELVERVGVQRQLAGAVLELDEPFRTTILLRFFEDLPPREIARRQGVPVTTVQSRLTRGVRKLRQRMDDARGTAGPGARRAWLGALLPLADARLAESAAGGTAATFGGLIVNAKLVVAASIAVVGTLAAVVTWSAYSGDDVGPGAVLASTEQEAALDGVALETPDVTRVPGERLEAIESPAELAAPTAVAPAVAEAVPERVRGRVFDADGAPVPGLALVLDSADGEPVATSGAGGWFELETTRDEGALVPDDPRWATVRSGAFRRGSTLEPMPVVAPAIEVTGRVVDEQGLPVGSAHLSIEMPRDFHSRFAVNLEGTVPRSWRTVADSDGNYRFERLPAIAEARIVAVLDGYDAGTREVPAVSISGHDIELRRPGASLAGSLRGRVVDDRGHPVPDARVAVGLTSMLTDDRGEFALDLARAVTANRIVAVKPGHRPAVLEREGGEEAPWPDAVTLRLGGPPLTITGVVVGPDGKPRDGVRVWLANPTRFGLIGRMPASTEALIAGALVPPQAVESASALPPEDGDNFWDETFPASAPSTAMWAYVRTDRKGRFTLEGLEDRDYELRVMDDDTLQLHTTDPIPAGSVGIELPLPRVRIWETLRGRVVTDDGLPLADVRVRVRAKPFGARSRVFGGTYDVSFWQSGDDDRTGSDGTFELRNVPKGEAFLTFSSDDIVPFRLELDADVDAEALIVTAEARCHVEVRLQDPVDRAERVAVADADGNQLDCMVISRGSTSAYTDIELVDGRSGVFSVSSRVKYLRLLSGEGEVLGRVPVRLVPGEVNLLEP